MIDFYRKYVAQGIFVAIFALIFTLLLRGWLFVNLTHNTNDLIESGGFLWNKIIGLFAWENNEFLISNFSIAILLGLIIAYFSWEYTLIREKTYLPFALSLILFNSLPDFFLFTPSALATLILFIAIFLMFDLYQHPAPQRRLFQISLILAITSLIYAGMLPYIIILPISLVFFRIFNLKNTLASLLGFAFVYWVTAIIAIPLGHTQDLLFSFERLKDINIFPCLAFTVRDWVASSVFVLLFLVVLVGIQFAPHKDKIKIRSQLDFLLFISALSFISSFLISWDENFVQFITFASFIIPLSHFFALNHTMGKVIFFYILLSAYLGLMVGETFGFSLL